MKQTLWAVVTITLCAPLVLAGKASGVFKVGEGEFKIGYAIADRDGGTGTVRILLAEQEPALADRDHHLDRLEALGEATDYRYIVLSPEPDGKSFNISTRIEGLSAGGGGLYESSIEIGDNSVSGSVDCRVMQGHLEVSFQADYLPVRKKLQDLPDGGGAPGAALLEQVGAAASGDREAIVATLSPEQVVEFNKLPADEQREAIEFIAEFAPRNVQIVSGVLYDGYAILEFEATQDGAPASGRALLVPEGEGWRVQLVSTQLN